MREEEDSAHHDAVMVDVEWSDDEPTRRFNEPELLDGNEDGGTSGTDNSSTRRVQGCSDGHKTPVGGVPALVRMTADEDPPMQPLGTLIRCHGAPVGSRRAAAVGVGVRFGRQPGPRGAERRTTLQLCEDVKAECVTTRMRRIAAALEVRLRDEDERNASVQVRRRIMVGLLLGIVLTWTIYRFVL